MFGERRNHANRDVEETSTLLPNTSKPSEYDAWNTFMIFIFPAIGGLLFGYDIGATSAVILQLQSSAYSGVNWYETIENSSALQGTIASMTMLGALIGCIIGFSSADSLGRKHSIMLGAALYCLGSCTEWLSGFSMFSAEIGISVLSFGRIFYGVGVGFSMQGAPAYIGEMAPTSIRGLLVSMKEAFIVLGMLLGYAIGYAYSTTPGGWRLAYGWASVLAVVMLTGMFHLPPSASWLAMNGHIEQASAALQFVTPNPTMQQLRSLRELSERTGMVSNRPTEAVGSSRNSFITAYRQLTAPTVWPAMLAGVGMVVFQQITGQPSVLYYADSIFQDVGVSAVASIAISLFKLLATLGATITVDRYGRKKLLYAGCALMLLALFCLGAAFSLPYKSTAQCNAYTELHSCPTSTCSWDADTLHCSLEPACLSGQPCSCCTAASLNAQKIAILVSLFVYIGGYQVGFGPIVWLLISEIFPLEVRGRAVALAVIVNFLLNTITTLIFPIEIQYIGPAATFFLFALILIGGLFYINRFVPETKGLSLEEIERFFVSGVESKQLDWKFENGSVDDAVSVDTQPTSTSLEEFRSTAGGSRSLKKARPPISRSRQSSRNGSKTNSPDNRVGGGVGDVEGEGRVSYLIEKRRQSDADEAGLMAML